MYPLSRYLHSIKKNFGCFCNALYFYRHCISSFSHKRNASTCRSYLSGADDSTVELIHEHFKLYENFISTEEENELLEEIDPIIKRRRYERDHWDGAIQGYKETEKSEWNEVNIKVLQRLRNLAFQDNSSQIKSVHVLDLSKDGFIKPHIDSIRFCGDTIAGISMLSSSVMRLALQENKDIFVDILLPRRSLYIMKGVARYNYTHEILEDSVSYFKGKQIVRDRRISVICRNEPVENS